jgi:signal transduction histidine kinase
MLYEFLTTNRGDLIRRARLKVESRRAPGPSPTELSNGVPLFLDQLIEILKRESTPDPWPPDEMCRTAARHGADLLHLGFTVAQVVHDYGDLCQAVTELASDRQVAISPEEFHTFNRCLDNAMATAVTAYGRQREESLSHVEVERLGYLAHEMRNLLSTMTLAFQALRRGTVGVAGSTGGVLDRTLAAMRHLVDRSLAEVRLNIGIEAKERLRVAELIEDVELWAPVDATSRNLRLIIAPVPYELFVVADRQLLAAALTNLLQNAFKFTPAAGKVTLRTLVVGGRVLVEVEDECGGLPNGSAEELFRPFAQSGADRTGLGLGLAIASKTMKASGGELRVRDIPGKGCVFTMELPEAAQELQAGAVH